MRWILSAALMIALAPVEGRAQNPVVNPPNPQSNVVVDLSEFLPGNTPYRAFANAFAACRQRHAAKLVIPPGQYVFDDPAIPNTGTGAAHIPVPFQTDLVIDGQGAELVFHYNQPGIAFVGCQRVLLRNIAIDWDIPMASPGQVIRMPDGRIAVRVADGYPVSSSTPVDAVSEYDVANRSWAKSRLDFTGRYEVYYPRNVQIVAPQTLYSPDFARLQEGLQVLVRHYTSGTSNAIEGDLGNEDLTFENVTIYEAPGAGFSFSLAGRGIRLSACTIALKPGADRFSTSDGGANFNLTRGDIIVENCDFSGLGDDSVNIAGGWLTVAKNDGTNVVEIKGSPPDFLILPQMAAPGDRLRFASSGDLSTKGEYEIRAVNFDQTRSILSVTLDRPAAGGDLVCNLNESSSNLLVRGNHFHNNRGRGMMIQTANGRIENNTEQPGT